MLKKILAQIKFPKRNFCEALKPKESVKQINISHIPNIKDFISSPKTNIVEDSFINHPSNISYPTHAKTFFIETYGCQMNENDTEIISTILQKRSFTQVYKMEDADIILTNTCAIRDSAEEKVWKNIVHIKGLKRKDPSKIFGILGCMAERMKEKILEKSNNIVDIIVGPDAYRDLPNMIDLISQKDEKENRHAINVQLSLEETYADIIPLRKSNDGIKAFLSIMRGCNNMCSFCIVPFTRGRERSRPFDSIIEEVKALSDNGIKEITLLGQNVNSFLDESYEGEEITLQHKNTPGFRELYKSRNKKGLRFAELIDKLSLLAPEVRFRFTSPHPKDFPEELIDIIASRDNICKQIHLPAQSGNNEVLKNMRRYYTREAYLELVQLIRKKIPNVALSSDFIAGFCGETEEQFNDTLTLINEVRYDMAYLFAYSMRDKTHAYHNFVDNVSEEDKKVRLNKMIEVFKFNQLEKNKTEIGARHLVLVEGLSTKKGNNKLIGRTDTNKICIFDNLQISTENANDINKEVIKSGEYITVEVNSCSNNTLFTTPICKTTPKIFLEISKGNPYYYPVL
jgi:tRNA-N(6)-(isopentenyl)adenosine-37 thiotransferase enzyme MiaB